MNKRVNIRIRGAVQGVGFRPFVYRLATELRLGGWVMNTPQGVVVEAEGCENRLREFVLRIGAERPPLAFVQSLEYAYLDPTGHESFAIRESAFDGTIQALMLPDIATCGACLEELADPSNRRYRYPFTNCTHCGPRYSIIESLPYDRPGTSMKGFPLCPECGREYADPLDRRFHAQPIACSVCGPHLELWDPSGRVCSTHDAALLEAADQISRGRIVAVKGLGGFQLVTAADNDEAIRLLRARKRREEKPFALMAPGLDAVGRVCSVSPLEERLLLSPESPIVLLQRKKNASPTEIAPSVAPGNPFLGIMLPYTPLHHLLLKEVGSFVVATSGNLSDEPLCIDEHEALRRLRGIADLFLVHDRPIVRQVDDSIVRVLLGRELMLRRARGYAPLPIPLSEPTPDSLAVGAQMKNTIAYARGTQAFVSQHIGDLETEESFDAFRRTVRSLGSAYAMEPAFVGADMHPDYGSTAFAQSLGRPVVPVQHHHAHIVSCMAENQIDGPVLGVSWDGTGYGPDGTVWGGEFLLADRSSFRREAALRTFMLPGGDRASREPRRSMLGLLYEMTGDGLFDRLPVPVSRTFTTRELAVMRTALRQGVNAPRTSSAGRLFDAVACLTGLKDRMSFEGQAAMELEFAAHSAPSEDRYPFTMLRHDGETEHAPAFVIDWEPALRAILQDLDAGAPVNGIASRFHNTLAEMIVEAARTVGEKRVVLSGGCFQNVYLAGRTILRLQAEGFQPYWHQRVPPNDGGIALGQIVAATANHQHTMDTMIKQEAL